MSTAHVSIRSALTQAFRPAHRGTAATFSVASFLVPCIDRLPKRHISASRHSKQERSLRQTHAGTETDKALYDFSPKPFERRPTSCIELPAQDARNEIENWLRAIEPFLPIQLRNELSELPDKSSAVTATDLALVLNAAQASNLDILSHLGLVEGRWAVVVWIAKKLVEHGKHSAEPLVNLDSFTDAHNAEGQPRLLDHLTENPIQLQRVYPPHKLEQSMNDHTSAPENLDLRFSIVKKALGQLWRSLGNMILAASERSSTDDLIMPHVLEIIAQLHHFGLMPDSVYTFHSLEQKYALQQPPTLHFLSSKILSALSDAMWKAHEAAVKLAKKESKTSYFLGHEIPGSRYRVVVSELAPELWLELVLWSCLHGGWTQDGTAILQSMANLGADQGWGLISWREIMQAQQQQSLGASRAWKLFPLKEQVAATPEDRARTRKTISSEVVTAFIDAIVSDVRVAVGSRGVDPEVLLQQIKSLKSLLDANNLSLGSATWDSIMARFLDSGGFQAEKRPELFLRIFELAAGFGAEVSTANTLATANDEVPYFFEPTALPLNLLHQAMRAFIDNGDIQGAMATFRILQQHTDDNKQKSLQQFFETLRNTAQTRKDQPFTSGLPPVDFPAFETNLPVPLRARLLDLATDFKEFELARWFLFAQDIDGPLIGHDLYGHRNVAASIVRFGALAGENDLVLEIINKVGAWNEKHQQQRMPAEILVALLCSQIKLHRWSAVQSMQEYVADVATFRPKPIILSTFAAELLRMSHGSRDDISEAEEAFASLLFAWEKLILHNVRNELYCILSIMSTIDTRWRIYCSRFLAQSHRQEVKLSTSDFNKLLSGVLDAYGSSRGKKMVQQWCYHSPRMFKSYQAPGGLITMPRFQVGKAEEYKERPKNIELVHESGATLTLRGRVHLNRQTIWVVLRKAREEVDGWRLRGEEMSATDRVELHDTIMWATRMLRFLGFDNEDIARNLDSEFAELAGLASAAANNGIEFDGANL